MNLESFEQEGKVGFKSDCKIVVPAIYESASYFHDGYAVVRLNGFSGVIDSQGKMIIPNQYDDITHLFGKYFCVRINEGDDWNCGVIDIDGKSIVEPSFKVIQHKEQQYFLCYKTAQSKVKDLNKYPPCKAFEYENFDDCVWCNLEGQVLTSLEVVNSSSFLVVKNEKGKLGVINQSGNIVIDFIYDTIEPCADGVFSVSIISKNETSYSVINSEGSIILSSLQKSYKFSNGFFYEQDEYQKTKWYSITGKLVFEGEANPLSSDYIAVSKNSKWGVVDKNGEKIINFLYSEVALLHECFTVLREDKIGLIDLNGKIIVDAIYNSVECVTINNAPYQLGNKKDLMRSYGCDILFLGYCPEYSFDTNGHFDFMGRNYDSLKRNIIKTSKNFRTSTFSISITPHIEFDLSKPLILVTDEYQELYLHREGIICNGRFSKIEQLTQICFAVKSEDLYGVYRVDTDSLIIPIEYSQIQFMGGHTVFLCKENLWGAKDLLLENNKFKSLFAVSIPCENLELKILDSSQTIFGAKKQYKNYKDELVSYFTILKKNGEEFADFPRCLDSQFKRYDNRHFLTSQYGKYGFVTLSGYASIPFIYDEIIERKGGNFNVRIGNAWGVIDIDGHELIPTKYATPIPLFIAKPKDVVFDYDDLKESNTFDNRIITNGNDLTILQDARSGFHGCVDINGKEVLPSVFEHLMFSNDENVLFFGTGGHCDDHCSFFSDISYATWGCVNKSGKIIIDAKYDCFKLIDGFILGGRDGNFVGSEDNNDYTRHDNYTGVYDLYTMEGELIIGGFREMIYDERQELFAFFFGGRWERYCSYSDVWNSLNFYDWRFSYLNDLWLIIDKNLNTIMRNADGTQHHFAKGFIGKIDIRKKDNKVSHVYNMPIHLMAKGFCSFGNNCAIIRNSNNDSCANKAILDTTTGKQSEYFECIRQISAHQFFFGKDRKCGITTITSEILPAEYQMFTLPVKGFFFAAKDLGDSNSQLTLRHMSAPSKVIAVAVSLIVTKDFISNVGWGRYKIEVGSLGRLADIQVPSLSSFDASFQSLISQEETKFVCGKWKDHYFFSSDWHFGPEDTNDSYDDDHDYMRDTWDAMTDGMYGDMPDGFDGDYDFLGR